MENTLKSNLANPAPLGLASFGMTILFFLLAASEFTGSAAIHKFAGYEGMVCGALALYEAMAQVLNEKYNRVVLPL